MAIQPQFGATAVYAYTTANITAANTATDGTGTVDFLKTNVAGTVADFLSGAGGVFIDSLEVMPRGTNVVTVVRLFSNANATNATAANNDLVRDGTMTAYTLSQVGSVPAPLIIPVKRWFPSGTKFFVTIGTAIAGGVGCRLFGSQM
jgi:hypothetical protein